MVAITSSGLSAAVHGAVVVSAGGDVISLCVVSGAMNVVAITATESVTGSSACVVGALVVVAGVSVAVAGLSVVLTGASAVVDGLPAAVDVSLVSGIVATRVVTSGLDVVVITTSAVAAAEVECIFVVVFAFSAFISGVCVDGFADFDVDDTDNVEDDDDVVSVADVSVRSFVVVLLPTVLRSSTVTSSTVIDSTDELERYKKVSPLLPFISYSNASSSSCLKL